MCLVVIAVDAHPRIALVLAANRDEYHARPAAPAAWGREGAFRDVLAGRDLMAGGTWLGVRRDGRFALVTNVREGKAQDPAARSRGELPLARAACRSHDRRSDGRDRRHRATTASTCSPVTPPASCGCRTAVPPTCAASPGRARTVQRAARRPWPKVVRTQERLQSWLRGDATSFEPLFDALGDRAQATDAELPSTGVPLAWERLLSSPFIVSDRYGTRCSTVLAIDRGGHARFVERSFAPDGTPSHEVAVEFELTARAAVPSPGAESRLP